MAIFFGRPGIKELAAPPSASSEQTLILSGGGEWQAAKEQPDGAFEYFWRLGPATQNVSTAVEFTPGANRKAFGLNVRGLAQDNLGYYFVNDDAGNASFTIGAVDSAGGTRLVAFIAPATLASLDLEALGQTILSIRTVGTVRQLGFFGAPQVPRQTITAAQYGALAGGTLAIADALIAYGLLEVV